MVLHVAQEKRTRLGKPNTGSMCAFSHALVMPGLHAWQNRATLAATAGQGMHCYAWTRHDD